MLNVGRIVRKQKVIQPPRHPRLVLGSRQVFTNKFASPGLKTDTSGNCAPKPVAGLRPNFVNDKGRYHYHSQRRIKLLLLEPPKFLSLPEPRFWTRGTHVPGCGPRVCGS
jgi:hypothetical protein